MESSAVTAELCEYKKVTASTASGNYLGCFQDDDSARALSAATLVDPNMTPFMCIDFCKTGNHQYAGVQVEYFLHKIAVAPLLPI